MAVGERIVVVCWSMVEFSFDCSLNGGHDKIKGKSFLRNLIVSVLGLPKGRRGNVVHVGHSSRLLGSTGALGIAAHHQNGDDEEKKGESTSSKSHLETELKERGLWGRG